MRQFAALVLLIVTQSGCALSPFRGTLACPKRFGPPWREYRSPHFDVSTDLRPTLARNLVAAFEKNYRAYIDVAGWHFPDRSEPPGRMRLIIFEDFYDYQEIGPAGSDGFFVDNTVDGEPLVVICTAGTHNWRELFLHELTHRLLRHYVAKAPLWIHEGLAEFYSTFAVDGNVVKVGQLTRRMMMTRFLPPPEEIVGLDLSKKTPSFGPNEFYAGAWMLIYVIARNFNSELGEALVHMAAGEEADAALTAAFGKDGLELLYRKYRDQVKAGLQTTVSWRAAYHAPEVPGVQWEQPLGDRDLHLLWASAHGMLSKGYLAQIDLADKHGGASPRSRFMRGMGYVARHELAPAERDIRAAVAEASDEERYRWALAKLHFDDAMERHLSDEQLAALEPEMAWLAERATTRDSLILLARWAARRSQFAEARARLTRALAIDSASLLAWDTLSTVALSQGDIDGALDATERALHLSPHNADTTALTQRLAKLRALREKREQRLHEQNGSD